MIPSSLHKKAQSKAGFALVIALGLMAFILLLMLSLTTFIRVESGLLKSHMERLQAQQNALLGVQIAIGELQRLTGPDRRVTAPTQILSGEDADFATPGNRFWTAVWDTQNKELLGYLVSGGSRPLASDAVNPIEFDAALINNRAASPDHVLLVGSSEATANGSILVPRQPVLSNAGLDGGAFGWWVGDLSTRSLLRSPRANIISSAPDYLHASRSAAEAIFPGALAAARFDSLNSKGQIALVSDSANVDLREHFHDLTIHSVGLHVNTREGGLRRSLNAAFEGDMDALHQFHADKGGTQIFGPQRPGNDDVGGPRWTQLQSFYNALNRISGVSANAAESPRLSTDDAGGIYPIPVHIQYWVHASLITADGGAVRTRLHVLPRIALWNPHNLAISGATYYFSFREPNYPHPAHNNNINVHLAYNRPGEEVRSQTVDQSTPFQFNQPIRLNVPDIKPGEVVLLTPLSNASASDIALTPGDRDTYYYLDHPNSFTLPADAENLELRVSPFQSFIRPADAPTSSLGGFIDMVLSLGPSAEAVSRQLRGITVTQRLDQLYHTIRYIPVFGFGRATEERLELTTFPANSPYVPGGAPDLKDLFGLGQWPSAGFYVSKRQPENFFQNQAFYRLPWLAHYNPRGRLSGRAAQDHAVSPISGRVNTTVNSVPGYVWATSLDKDFYDSVFRLAPQIGLSDFSGPSRSVLFEVPRRKSDIRSIGQLTHAHLSIPAGNVLLPSVSPGRLSGETGPMLNEVNRPAYAIGNSLADPHLGHAGESDLNQLSRIFRDSWPNVAHGMPPETTAYDWSFLLNQELFDRYFLSTASEDWFNNVLSNWQAGDPLPSLPQTRYRLHVPVGFPKPGTASDWEALLSDFERAAAFVQIDGAFNVNSTSVAAWQAELSGLIGSNDSLSGVAADEVPFVRAAYPLESGFSGGNNSADEVHAGYRKLNQGEVRRLAETLVEEIRERGPVSTIAEFVNRDPSADRVEHRLQGRIAAAIVRAGINNDLQDPFSFRNDFDNAPQLNNSYRDFANLALEGPRLQNAPGFLSSADIVAKIGANWTARGDSFVIRSYGDAGGGIGGAIGTRIVCEVVVQRQIAARSDDAGFIDLEPEDAFGYRYQVIAFRWISQNEL